MLTSYQENMNSKANKKRNYLLLMRANIFDSTYEASYFNIGHINFHYVHIDSFNSL